MVRAEPLNVAETFNIGPAHTYTFLMPIERNLPGRFPPPLLFLLPSQQFPTPDLYILHQAIFLLSKFPSSLVFLYVVTVTNKADRSSKSV